MFTEKSKITDSVSVGVTDKAQRVVAFKLNREKGTLTVEGRDQGPGDKPWTPGDKLVFDEAGNLITEDEEQHE